MEWLQGLLSQLTYSIGPSHPESMLALFALGALTDIGFPFPFILETFLLFASYSVGPLSAPVLFALLMLLLGREFGSAILYLLLRQLGYPLLNWLSRRIPGLSREINRFRPRIMRRMVISVVAVRLTPGLLQVPTLISGSMRLPYFKFLAGVAISGIANDFGLIMIGYLVRLVTPNVSKNMEITVVISALVVLIIVWAVLFWRFTRVSNGNPPSNEAGRGLS